MNKSILDTLNRRRVMTFVTSTGITPETTQVVSLTINAETLTRDDLVIVDVYGNVAKVLTRDDLARLIEIESADND